MKPGDYVLCVSDNAYHYAARVLAKYDRRQFAKRVWGTKDGGERVRRAGFDMVTVATDAALLSAAARREVSAVRGERTRFGSAQGYS